MTTYAFKTATSSRVSDGANALEALNALLVARDGDFLIGDAAGYRILACDVDEPIDAYGKPGGDLTESYPIAITITHVGKRAELFPGDGVDAPTPQTTTFYGRKLPK